PGDVATLLPLELKVGEALGVAHRLLERRDADLGGGDLGDALQEVEPALAERLDRVVQRGIACGTARGLAGTALGDLEGLVESEGVVRDVAELVQPRRVGGANGQRAPLEV